MNKKLIALAIILIFVTVLAYSPIGEGLALLLKSKGSRNATVSYSDTTISNKSISISTTNQEDTLSTNPSVPAVEYEQYWDTTHSEYIGKIPSNVKEEYPDESFKFGARVEKITIYEYVPKILFFDGPHHIAGLRLWYVNDNGEKFSSLFGVGSTVKSDLNLREGESLTSIFCTTIDWVNKIKFTTNMGESSVYGTAEGGTSNTSPEKFAQGEIIAFTWYDDGEKLLAIRPIMQTLRTRKKIPVTNNSPSLTYPPSNYRQEDPVPGRLKN
ncbi:MAG: hypothetical protein MUF71_14285 [Candidatus Kapabacteria bacterium]|jgi:hypothetical protein|nr:hypothetical protein [Candidatus Kapabacteria bacterium]